jgi:hypothetical protein
MFKRNKLLCLLILALLSGSVYWGCEQPEDVLTPLTRTNIWLDETKLPSNPEGMVYELWVADASDTVSLGKFAYDLTLHRYLEINGNVRADSNQFSLGYDALNFTSILISVETTPDNNTNSPGPIMLMGTLSDPTVRMRFPKIDSLWSSTIWYNMESPSDGLDPITDGYAVWFSTYQQLIRDFDDTLSILDWWVDSIPNTIAQPGDTVINEVGFIDGSICTLTVDDVFGLDTLTRTYITYEVKTDTATDIPYWTTYLRIQYEITEGTVVYDYFNQGESDENPDSEFGMPYLLDYGWKYKPWVISPQIDSTLVTNRITLPAWRTFSPWLDETEGAMLTTGSFSNPTQSDDGNPYLVSSRCPNYPGEDFLANMPGDIPAVNLVPYHTGNPGRIIISLEPINSVTDTTNFPLIAYAGEFPADYALVQNGNLIQAFILRGWFAQEADTDHGFPWVGVTLERF